MFMFTHTLSPYVPASLYKHWWTLVTLVKAEKLELETKVHTNIRNHGEGPY